VSFHITSSLGDAAKAAFIKVTDFSSAYLSIANHAFTAHQRALVKKLRAEDPDKLSIAK
jgi:hypothetical protein